MEISTHFIQFDTKGHTDIIDITGYVQQILQKEGYQEGTVHVFSVGSTCSITTVEYEPGLVQTDLAEMFEQLAPYGRKYAHNKTWGDDNGAAHLRSSLTGSSISIPFIEGKLLLGTWQQVIFIDFDTRPRKRKAVVQITGVKN